MTAYFCDNVIFILHRFKHKNPEDPAEVPGGFLTDINEVRKYFINLSLYLQT